MSDERKNDAEKVYQKALETAKNRKGYEAFRLILQTLEMNPDHEAARKILNQILHDGKWRTDWEIKQLERGQVDHERFGWIPREFAERYENSERYFAKEKRWVSEAEDARLHCDMRDGWVISSEHYDVRTNHSWEEGVKTSRKLEHLNRAWRMLFFNMLFTESKLATQILNPPRTPAKPQRHRVLIYRNQANYVKNLRELEPQIERTNGYYLPRTATAYFFPVSEEMDDFVAESTQKALLHEATHQLFQEAKTQRKEILPRSNYWVAEGIAMLFETFREENNRYVIGDLSDTRLFAAKVYFEQQNFFMPTEKLARLGAEDFPKQLNIYAQSAGLVHLLMFANAGQDREALLALLQKTYDGSAGPSMLKKLLGRDFEMLDQEYKAFLQLVP